MHYPDAWTEEARPAFFFVLFGFIHFVGGCKATQFVDRSQTCRWDMARMWYGSTVPPCAGDTCLLRNECVHAHTREHAFVQASPEYHIWVCLFKGSPLNGGFPFGFPLVPSKEG